MNKLLLLKKSKGFTLIEVLITLSILAIVMAVGSAVLIQIFDIIPATNERMSTRQLAEINLSTISTLIRNAETVNHNSNTITIKENGTSKTIEYQDKSIKKGGEVLINDIKTFSIEEDNDAGQEKLYIVTIEKCDQQNCEESIELTEQVLHRE